MYDIYDYLLRVTPKMDDKIRDTIAYLQYKNGKLPNDLKDEKAFRLTNGECPFGIEDDNDNLIADYETRGNVDEWIDYIIKLLKRYKYTLNGYVKYSGDYPEDQTEIIIKDNIITVKKALIIMCEKKDRKYIKHMIKNYLDEPLKELMNVAYDDEMKKGEKEL